jgi:excinuclease UvrABC ATPase subunit
MSRASACPRDTGQLIDVLAGRARAAIPWWWWSTISIIRAADYIVDLGPGAGERGGSVVYREHLTRRTARRERDISRMVRPRNPESLRAGAALKISGVRSTTSRIDVAFPLGRSPA